MKKGQGISSKEQNETGGAGVRGELRGYFRSAMRRRKFGKTQRAQLRRIGIRFEREER